MRPRLRHARNKTYGVKVGDVHGGRRRARRGAVHDQHGYRGREIHAEQTMELAEAGSEIVRWTVNVPEAAAAVPEIKQRLLDAGCNAPIIGDFHYNGHVLLTKYPECARRWTNTASIREMWARASGATSNFPRFAKWRAITASRCASA